MTSAVRSTPARFWADATRADTAEERWDRQW